MNIKSDWRYQNVDYFGLVSMAVYLMLFGPDVWTNTQILLAFCVQCSVEPKADHLGLVIQA